MSSSGKKIDSFDLVDILTEYLTKSFGVDFSDRNKIPRITLNWASFANKHSILARFYSENNKDGYIQLHEALIDLKSKKIVEAKSDFPKFLRVKSFNSELVHGSSCVTPNAIVSASRSSVNVFPLAQSKPAEFKRTFATFRKHVNPDVQCISNGDYAIFTDDSGGPGKEAAVRVIDLRNPQQFAEVHLETTRKKIIEGNEQYARK